MRSFDSLFAGWRLAGVLAGVAGAGASAMAITVKASIAEVKSAVEHHDTQMRTQSDSLLIELRQQRDILNKQLCIMVGVTPKIQCLQ